MLVIPNLERIVRSTISGTEAHQIALDLIAYLRLRQKLTANLSSDKPPGLIVQLPSQVKAVPLPKATPEVPGVQPNEILGPEICRDLGCHHGVLRGFVSKGQLVILRKQDKSDANVYDRDMYEKNKATMSHEVALAKVVKSGHGARSGLGGNDS